MLAGGVGFLFFAILAMVQFTKYNAAWEQDLINTGSIVWARHWSNTKYPLLFEIAMAGSASLVFLYIFADRAFDVEYVEKYTDVYLENEYSWFQPTTIVFEEKTKEHTYFLKVILFGFGSGISIVGLWELLLVFAFRRMYASAGTPIIPIVEFTGVVYLVSMGIVISITLLSLVLSFILIKKMHIVDILKNKY